MATPPVPLRLADAELAVAAALAATPGHALLERPESRAILERLSARGLLEAGAPAEPLATIARTVARPAVRVEARVRRPEGTREIRGWTDEDRAVVGDVDEGETRLVLVPWTAFPAALAARLGLREASPPPSGAAARPLPGRGGDWRAAWEVTARWRAGARDEARFLRVLDRGPAGLWRVKLDAARAELVPIAPDEAERALVELLP